MQSSVHDPKIVGFLRALTSALKSHQLYRGTGPAFERQVAALAQASHALWQEVTSLTLVIREHRFEHDGVAVGAGEELAALFYRDGVREITLTPGFETEAPRLVATLGRAPQGGSESDDLVTLLWEKSFEHLSYRAVEPGADGLNLPLPGVPAAEPVAVAGIRADAGDAPRTTVSAADFSESLYFLDETEIRQLAADAQEEAARDVWHDIISGLLDRLSDASEARQIRILKIFEQFLPALLAAKRLDEIARILRESQAPSSNLTEEARVAALGIGHALASQDVLEPLLVAARNAPDTLAPETLPTLFQALPVDALEPLLALAETGLDPALKRLVGEAIDRISSTHPGALGRLLETASDDALPALLALIADARVQQAAASVATRLSHINPDVRVQAARTLQTLGRRDGAEHLIPLLEDHNEAVRIAGARAIGALRVAAALPALESRLASNAAREASRAEKVAYFDAYARVAGADGVSRLSHILHTRSWLGRPSPSDLRAAAAMALGQIPGTAATEALQRAAHDKDPVVRGVVTQALQDRQS